jgi:surfeit locus 1 family protein
MTGYGFALRPRWILSHVLVLALVVSMIGLGFWQLRRLDEKRDHNAVVRAAQAAPVADNDDVATADDAFRRATATGEYDTGEEVMVRSRTKDGRPGVWVLTPLVRDDGTAVVVNRGFLATQGVPDQVPADAAPPDGEVDVSGVVQASQRKGRFGSTDPDEVELTSLARADIERLQQQVPYPLLPVYLQLTEQDPPQPGELPEPVPLPPLDEGPHLSYAVQWFIFTTIALVGYPIILRRRAREPVDESRD